MLLIFEIFLVGGVVYTGIKTFRKQKQGREASWLTARDEAAPTPEAVSVPDQISLAQLEPQINRDFTISSVSLGLSITGGLVYPPLGVASIPLTIYGALPTFENAYQAFFSRSRTKMAMVSSIVIIGTLAANYYFLASLVQWSYHLNQKLLVEMNYNYRQLLLYLFGPTTRSIWILVNEVEVKIPRNELTVGDIVVVNEGELIPVDGIIVDGVGLIDMYILTGQSRPVEKSSGDKVFAATDLLSGRICVRAEKVK
ncbi:MAG: hypothetical protein SVT56_07480, partial [Chloroflexota bacterium]|nr:hypothetical protein [Chloroflexota bacterium]